MGIPSAYQDSVGRCHHPDPGDGGGCTAAGRRAAGGCRPWRGGRRRGRPRPHRSACAARIADPRGRPQAQQRCHRGRRVLRCAGPVPGQERGRVAAAPAGRQRDP
ncbi:hypothetical protein G6F59_016643 [Rhizopus arrhizus]|nr:hypothetical protein G6F59_016643 [Rhizopus arrhizus]